MFDKKKYYREYYKKNRKRFLGYIKKYQNSEKGKLTIRKWNKKYYKTDKFKELSKKYYTKNRSNPEWVVNERLRVYQFKVLKKVGNLDARKLINRKAIIKHLRPFPKDLLIYEIDHKIPLSKFKLRDNNDIKKAFAPKNYQWLPIWQNKLKRNKTQKEFEEEIKEARKNILNW